MKIKLTKDIRSCNECGKINYKPNFSFHAEYSQELYELRIGYTVLCVCKDCLKELCSLANEILNKKGK